jgi:hypothetical protein
VARREKSSAGLIAFGVTSSDHPIVAYLRWPVMFVLIIFALSVCSTAMGRAGGAPDQRRQHRQRDTLRVAQF